MFGSPRQPGVRGDTLELLSVGCVSAVPPGQPLGGLSPAPALGPAIFRVFPLGWLLLGGGAVPGQARPRRPRELPADKSFPGRALACGGCRLGHACPVSGDLGSSWLRLPIPASC